MGEGPHKLRVAARISKASIFSPTNPGAAPTTHRQLAGKASNTLVGLRCWDHSLMLSASDALAERSRLPKQKFNNSSQIRKLQKHEQAAFSESHQLGSNCFGNALAHELQRGVLRRTSLVVLCRRESKTMASAMQSRRRCCESIRRAPASFPQYGLMQSRNV